MIDLTGQEKWEARGTSRSFNLNMFWVSTGLTAKTSQELVSNLLNRIAANALKI